MALQRPPELRPTARLSLFPPVDPARSESTARKPSFAPGRTTNRPPGHGSCFALLFDGKGKALKRLATQWADSEANQVREGTLLFGCG
jgi:hypothetical protein